MKCGCLIYIFLNSANLICRGTVISMYFRDSLRLRDNESWLYVDEALLMNSHNVCFRVAIIKIFILFYWKKRVLPGAMFHLADILIYLVITEIRTCVWKRTFEHVRPVKIQIRTGWSESSLSAFHLDSKGCKFSSCWNEDSDQTARMRSRPESSLDAHAILQELLCPGLFRFAYSSRKHAYIILPP